MVLRRRAEIFDQDNSVALRFQRSSSKYGLDKADHPVVHKTPRPTEGDTVRKRNILLGAPQRSTCIKDLEHRQSEVVLLLKVYLSNRSIVSM